MSSAVKQSTFSMSSGHAVVGQGLLLGSSSALVDRNSITGLGAGVAACNLDGYGVSGGSTASRIQNNRIYGAKAPTSSPLGCAVSSSVYGIQSAVGQVYSNHIGAWPNGSCATAINGDPRFYGVVTSAGGDYRNNAIEGCAAVKEANASADPMFFQNNALIGGYLDEGGDFPNGLQPDTRINVAQVNALTDMTSSSNIDGPCYAAGSDKLAAGSVCIDAGTPSGAPAFDYDSERRGAAPDIGSDEYVP